MQLKPIDQQVVVVMGASSGIGREAAKRFAQRGAKVVVAARNQDGLETLVREIRERGGVASPVVADVTDFAQVKAAADEAVEQYGRLDTWAHVAGVSLYATFDEVTPEEFKRVIEVNLVGQAYGAMAALPHLKREGRGALIHVSSIESQLSFPYQSAYAASKHGIPGFLDALRLELRHEGMPISVTNIMPAAINTPLFDKARTKLGVKPAVPPPVYQPGTVADQIVYAAEHPVRDMIAGGAGKMFIQTQRISPALMDALMLLAGFESQKTDEPKSVDGPNNLFAPIAGQNRVEGDFGQIALDRSLYNWLGRHPYVRRSLAGAALGVATLLSVRAASAGR
jgi:NAD(P)-dependent dehydrogenase (short-subunit alcohol dehydrogenase family)